MKQNDLNCRDEGDPVVTDPTYAIDTEHGDEVAAGFQTLEAAIASARYFAKATGRTLYVYPDDASESAPIEITPEDDQ